MRAPIFMFVMPSLTCLACGAGQRDGTEVPEPESYPPGAMDAPSDQEKTAIAELGPMEGCAGRFPTSNPEPTPTSTEAKNARGREPKQIQEGVRSHFSEFQGCYEPRLRFDHHLEGRVGIKFIILPNGDVTGVHILESTIPDCFVPSCLVDVFQSMTFPASEGDTTVTYPLMLSPG
jgi:hypothetical protein